MSGLFGASTTATQQKPNLFGSLNTNTGGNQPQAPGGLFGSTLGANNAPQPQQAGGLFGASQNAPAQPQLQQQQQQGGGLFGSTLNAPQQQQGGGLFGSTMNASQQQPRLGGSVWQGGSTMRSGERPIIEQMQTLFNKWNPESANCSFQNYFYNSVNPEHVPYYGPNGDEDPQKWEEALQKRPTEGSVPVLARGFVAVGQRLELQAKSLQVLHQRLHEINDSLLALMQKHDLEISTRCAEAKRKHIALSARCLRLATKVQVLRYKGYPLDGAEEVLKKKLTELEKAASDPALEARSNEIWARMHNIRVRITLIQGEAERLGKKIGNGEEKIDDATMAAIKKLLSDYDSQLNHLKKELERIRTDYAEWEQASKPVSTGSSGR